MAADVEFEESEDDEQTRSTGVRDPLAGDWTARTERMKAGPGGGEEARLRSLRKASNRSYAFVGFLVLCFLVAALLLGFAGFTGPTVFGRNVNWLIGICLLGLAIGVLYVLFTMRSAMRHIREQAILLARLGERADRATATAWRSESVWQGEPAWRPSPSPAPVPAAQTESTAPSAPPSAPAPAASVPRYSRPVEVLEGIGPTYSRRLAGIGVKTLDDLRQADEGQIREAVKPLAPTAPHQWKAMADLMILNGVDAQAAELLVRSGCETIADLGGSDPASLHRRLIVVNRTHGNRVYPNTLHAKDVERWVNAARRNERRDLGYGMPSATATANAV